MTAQGLLLLNKMESSSNEAFNKQLSDFGSLIQNRINLAVVSKVLFVPC